MYLQTTRFLQLLFICVLTTGAPVCDKDGPGNCQFADKAGIFTLCGWTNDNNFEIVNSTFGGYIQLVRGSDTGSLTSRTACSTEGQAHCFRFSYQFDVNEISTLSVGIKYGLNESLLWIFSSGVGGWNEASVPITTHRDFNVLFKAERHCGQNENPGSVRIDAIRYGKTSNSCSFQPETASPTLVPAIPSSCNSTIPLPSATQSTSISHEISTETISTAISHETVTETTVTEDFYVSSSNGGNQQIRTSANPTTTTTTTTVTPTDTTLTADSNTSTSNGVQQTRTTTMANIRPPPSRDDEDEPVESSIDIGIIAGVVVGVIVIIVIVVLLLVLFRRKRRHSWEANNAQPNPDSRHSNESPPTQQSDNCNIMRDPQDPTTSAESAMPIYAVVNKSQKTRQENPPLNPYEIYDQSSEQHWQNAESESANEQGQDRDGITSTPTNPFQLMAGTESVYQVPRGDPTVNSEDQGEKYNALDFEGNRCVADHDHPEGKHKSGAGDLYSHLNDGEDVTYSEVDRQKRPEVVDDEYSHI